MIDAPQNTGVPSKPFFKNWFWQVLRWPLLMSSGPVACLCAGIAHVADAVWPDIRWFVEQFNPATCEIEYVDQYAKSRGLVRHYTESDVRWRRRVCAAQAWHKLAGRTFGMPQILAHYGYSGAIMINRATEGKPALWAHFRAELVTGDYPVTEEDWELIRWILNETKPAKSVLESLTVVVQSRLKVRVALAAVHGEIITIAPWTAKLRETRRTVHIFIGQQHVEYITITPKNK